jgi:type I restriction enzyme S subunit
MIKLKKDVWVIKNIDEVCESIFAGGDVPKNSFSKTKTDKLTVPIFSNGEKDKGLFGYTDIEIVIKPSLTISARGTIGYSEIREGRYYPAVRLIVLIPNIRIIDLFFLKIAISNIDFASSGTSIPQLTVPMVKKYAIPLPPLDEQQRIVELFQSIEQSIVQTEAQEKNLKLLQKTLSNGLVNNQPSFGNLLSKKVCKPCLFSDIVECIEKHDKSPLEHGLTRFIGLENIASENFTVQGFGNIEDGTTFTKRFAKGDVLFGKRRAYLKKVAVADYDGICSSDILVFRAIEKEILPELLPYYVSSDSFINHAVSTSAGSLSPRTKWKDLAGFQLSTPDIKTQEKIVDVMNQLSQSLQLIIQQKETLKKLKQKLLNEILG